MCIKCGKLINCEKKLEEINDIDREKIAEAIKQGNTLGILDSEEYRIAWKIDIIEI